MSKVMWVALLPDPATGLDAPVERAEGGVHSWPAEDKAAATALVKQSLTPAQFRLASVVSLVDWVTRKAQPQRRKLIQDGFERPRYTVRNPDMICQTCGVPVSVTAYYCPAHRSWKQRRGYLNRLGDLESA